MVTAKRQNNPIVEWIETKAYRGEDRRALQNSPRVPCLEPCSIDDENPETKPFIGKCVNIGPGGAKILLHEILNKFTIVMITFYKHVGREFEPCVPVTGRVSHIHPRKDGWFVANIDFRGAVYHEHGIEIIMNDNIRRIEEQEKNQKNNG